MEVQMTAAPPPPPAAPGGQQPPQRPEECLIRWTRSPEPYCRAAALRNARVPPRPGPHASPAHLVLERVIGDVLQVDEHVEISPKHARLQGLGRHLQQAPGTELAGRTPNSPHSLRPPGPRLVPSRLISSAPGVPRRHKASGGPGRDVQNGGFQPSPPDTDDNPSLTSASERRKRGPEGGEASRLQAWATAHVPGVSSRLPTCGPRVGRAGGNTGPGTNPERQEPLVLREGGDPCLEPRDQTRRTAVLLGTPHSCGVPHGLRGPPPTPCPRRTGCAPGAVCTSGGRLRGFPKGKGP